MVACGLKANLRIHKRYPKSRVSCRSSAFAKSNKVLTITQNASSPTTQNASVGIETLRGATAKKQQAMKDTGITMHPPINNP